MGKADGSKPPSTAGDDGCEEEDEVEMASFFFFTWGLGRVSSGPWSSDEPSTLLSEDGCTVDVRDRLVCFDLLFIEKKEGCFDLIIYNVVVLRVGGR